MKVGCPVVLIKNLVPSVMHISNPLTAENSAEEIDFENMRPNTPKIEEAISAGFDKEENSQQKADEHQWERGCRCAAKSNERAMPVLTTAQFVVASRRVRQTVLR